MLAIHLTTLNEITIALRTVKKEVSPRPHVSQDSVNGQQIRGDEPEKRTQT